MSDSYRAIYDAATRAFDISHAVEMIRNEFQVAAYEMQRPSVLYRPIVKPDGDKWHALYGPNPMDGVVGVGDTPADAMADFDKNWMTQKMPMAGRG